jgi:Regulator of chromosome condensation (RCC1) repeat
MSRPAPSLLRHTLPLLIALVLLLLARRGDAQARWASVSVGDDHVCALDEQGRAYCFGNNHAGQLGARTQVHCGIVGESGHRSCYPLPSDSTPLRAGGEMRFAAVTAGRYVSCGLDAEGRAFCWGDAMADHAAYRDKCLLQRPCSFAPVPLMPERRFASVAMKPRCALDVEGTAFCWGIDFRTSGRAVTPWPGIALAQVDGESGEERFCATARDGRAYCLGDAAFGVLGTGSRDSADAGRPVDSQVRFARVAVLYNWACGLDAEGAAHCWGAAGYDDATRDSVRRADFEQCERWGTRTWCNTRPAPVHGGLRFGSLAAMPRGSMPVVYEMVGITAEGAAYAWRGDRVPRPWHPENRWRAASAGEWGQCGVTVAGELFCWGRDPHEEVQGRIPHPDARHR